MTIKELERQQLNSWDRLQVMSLAHELSPAAFECLKALSEPTLDAILKAAFQYGAATAQLLRSGQRNSTPVCELTRQRLLRGLSYADLYRELCKFARRNPDLASNLTDASFSPDELRGIEAQRTWNPQSALARLITSYFGHTSNLMATVARDAELPSSDNILIINGEPVDGDGDSQPDLSLQ